MKHFLLPLMLSGFLFLGSCSEDPEPVNEPPVSTFKVVDDLDRMSLHGEYSKDADGDPLTYFWTSSSSSIQILNTQASKTYFKIPEEPVPGMIDITLTVSDGMSQNTSSVSLEVPTLSPTRSIGLGKTLGQEKDNAVPYGWYFDQNNTGSFSLINCGPTSVTMAVKWAQEDFAGTPQDARNTYRADGGWWYTYDIISYLQDYDVNNWTANLSNMNVVRNEIDNGNIAILCLDMYYVKEATTTTFHVDKFYKTDGPEWGHFIIVKGYKIVDGNTFFEVYDPYSMGNKYDDGAYKGLNRYYRSDDLASATGKWWPFVIFVSKAPAPPGARKSVSNAKIFHKPGR